MLLSHLAKSGKSDVLKKTTVPFLFPPDCLKQKDIKVLFLCVEITELLRGESSHNIAILSFIS